MPDGGGGSNTRADVSNGEAVYHRDFCNQYGIQPAFSGDRAFAASVRSVIE
jgi:hypothetical protein